jgi:hypothetical protein
MDGSSLADEPPCGDNREYEFFPDISGRDPSRPILEAASWTLTTEVVRRYPDRFSVIETHPGSGQYDCITLIDEDKDSNLSKIDLNRVGSIWVHRRDHSVWTSRDCWQEVVTADDLRPQLDRLRVHAGLPPVGLAAADRLPRSTRSVVAYRVIAAFMAHQVFSGAAWRCLTGYLDSSGMGGGVRGQFFDKFPEARERMANSVTLFDEDWQAAYGFWFLAKDDEPRLAIEPGQGTAWASDGRKIDLFAKYQRTHKIWPVVWAAAGHLMP